MSIGRLGGTLELLELIELSLWNCPPAVLEPSSWNFSPRTLHLELFLELQHSSCNSTPGKGARTLHRLYSGSKSDPQSGPKGAPPEVLPEVVATKTEVVATKYPPRVGQQGRHEGPNVAPKASPEGAL